MRPRTERDEHVHTVVVERGKSMLVGSSESRESAEVLRQDPNPPLLPHGQRTVVQHHHVTGTQLPAARGDLRSNCIAADAN